MVSNLVLEVPIVVLTLPTLVLIVSNLVLEVPILVLTLPTLVLMVSNFSFPVVCNSEVAKPLIVLTVTEPEY